MTRRLLDPSRYASHEDCYIPLCHMQEIQCNTIFATKCSPFISFQSEFSEIDFTGHLWVKDRKKKRKMYLLCFTCLNFRVVHIELVPDISILSLFQVFIWFTNLHGISTTFVRDNSKMFLNSSKLLNCFISSHDVQEHFGHVILKMKQLLSFLHSSKMHGKGLWKQWKLACTK